MRYSASRNSVTLKTGVGVVQDQWKRRRSIADHVHLSLGKSYTVLVLKNKNSVHCKSMLMIFVAYRLVRPYWRYSNIVYYTGIVISLRLVITSLVLSKAVAVRMSCVQCVVDYYVNCGSMINICALDLSNAFDKMNHCGFFIKLMERRIPDMLLYVI